MKKIALSAAVALLIMAGCSKEKTVQTPGLAPNELGVNIRIAGEISTRVGGGIMKDALSLSGDEVSVFITGGTGATAYVPKVANYTYDGTSLWISPLLKENKIFLSNVLATVYGFYPSSAAVSGTLANDNTNQISLAMVSSVNFDGRGQWDYMYATSRTGTGPYTYPMATASNAENANKVDLYFHHALSKLSFVINKADTYTGAGELTKVQLSSAANIFQMPDKMKVLDGTLSGGTPVNTVSLTGTATINAYNATPSTTIVAKGLFAPMAATSGITLTLNVDGKDMSVALPSSAPADLWAAGKNYTYTITVNGTELVVNSVVILPWEEIAGGNADVQ
jgi:hypothetical protein